MREERQRRSSRRRERTAAATSSHRDRGGGLPDEGGSRTTIAAAAATNIQYCTLFAFSTENWSRPKYEIYAIFGLIEDMVRRYRRDDPAIRDGRVRIRLLGDIDDARIPASTRAELGELVRTSGDACDERRRRRRERRRRRRRRSTTSATTTRLDDDDDDDGDLGVDDDDDDDDISDDDDDRDDALTVCLAINYGGRADILRAAAQLARSIADDAARTAPSHDGAEDESPNNRHPTTAAAATIIVNDEAEISERLCTSGLPDVDLIIRTGGERRLSNFFLWEGAYAELYFCDTLWPDFDDASLAEALDWYGKRERRFGGRTQCHLNISK
jgi:undecaprenyl pyrophosphate synthase